MRRLAGAVLALLVSAPLLILGAAAPAQAAGASSTFKAEVWADNWFALYVNGKLVGQDSVPITTERSFNAETITFTATYPLTIALVAKDFKQDDSGLEYIGTNRQQMGDGGIIAQITDTNRSKVIAATSRTWKALVVHQAPLNVSCVTSRTPIADCGSKIIAEPARWKTAAFNDTSWQNATVYTPQQVGVKEGHTTITWSPSASLIWGSNLQTDNTVLLRFTAKAP